MHAFAYASTLNRKNPDTNERREGGGGNGGWRAEGGGMGQGGVGSGGGKRGVGQTIRTRQCLGREIWHACASNTSASRLPVEGLGFMGFGLCQGFRVKGLGVP